MRETERNNKNAHTHSYKRVVMFFTFSLSLSLKHNVYNMGANHTVSHRYILRQAVPSDPPNGLSTAGVCRVWDSVVCVGCLFFKDTEPSPLQDSFSVCQQGGLPGPPPVIPHPESIDAQAAFRCRHST